MKRENGALLVIDMQLVAFDGKITPPISNGSELLKTTAGLIEACRTAGIPIVYLQTCAVSGQPYARDVHGWEIHPEIAPLADDRIVYKVQSNGFEETNLDDVLTEIGVTALIVCGIWSEYCVTATSKAALELGYPVWVAADAHGTVASNDEDALEVVAKQNRELARSKAITVDVEDIKAELTEVHLT